MSAEAAGEGTSGSAAAADPWRAQMAGELAALNLRVAQLEHLLAASAQTAHTLPAEHQPDAAGRSREEQSLRSAVPPPPPAAGETMHRATAGKASLEDRIGAQIFNWIGMAALLIGASWALKLAFEHGLIGPAGRVTTGLAAGAALIVWSERFRRKALPAFSYSLKAVGSGVLYLSLWAALQLYHLLPAAAAFAAMALVTAWIAYMAWAQDAELLAAYALAGGLATPLLLSTGGDHETFLFSYLLALDLATALLLRAKPWVRLLPAAFLATVAYFIAWYVEFFHRGGGGVWDGQSTLTSLFALLIFAVFTLAPLRFWRAQGEAARSRQVVDSVLLPLANAAFVALALYSVLQDSGLHSALAWVMLALAAVALGLVRLQASGTAAAVQVAIAVVLVTVAIPLKASGQSLTTAWLVEGLVLCWVALRVEDDAVMIPAAGVLRWLSAGGYALGLLALGFNRMFRDIAPHTFWNANLGTSLVAAAALGGAVWLASRRQAETLSAVSLRTIVPALLGVDVVALLLAVDELGLNYRLGPREAFANPAFFTALVGLALFGAVCWTGYRLRPYEAGRGRELTALAGGTLIVLNLCALVAGVREISALWLGEAGAETSVQRSLAISAFLMLYGAGLLAAGFWRRSAFVRWQALVLLIFTILKVFLYDVSGLSQGYRVASFLGLGALLMAVSLAYQRDWLGLKAAALPPAATEPDARP